MANGEEIAGVVERKVMGLAMAYKRSMETGNTKGYELAAQALRVAVSTDVVGKRQGLASLSETRMADSARTLASGVQIYGTENAHSYLGKLEFDGINLAHAASAKGGHHEYDAVFASKKYFEDRGYFDKEFLASMNMTDQQMRRHLKTKGSIAINLREPAAYMTSTSPAALYLNESLRGNTQVTAALWARKGGDFDSDTLGLVEAKTKVSYKVGKQSFEKDLNYAQYQILQANKEVSGIKMATPNFFNDLRAYIHTQGMEGTSPYSILGKESDKRLLSSIDLTVAKRYAIDDMLKPRHQFHSSISADVERAMGVYNEVQDAHQDLGIGKDLAGFISAGKQYLHKKYEGDTSGLNTAKTDYLFYLTGKDGQMHYAKTLSEHNANVAKYL